ncbi:hypothetical protein CULT_2650001 [[Clostridium] ultunense Esp]|nr:hypothetical protein CULT_2650001 [[Clostridium] ultunense Esp]
MNICPLKGSIRELKKFDEAKLVDVEKSIIIQIKNMHTLLIHYIYLTNFIPL